MNERILELARQIWPDPSISHVNHMRFAELLIRECSHIAKVNQLQSMNWDIGEILLEHFGVE